MCRCSWSTSPAARYWFTVLAPPAMATFCSPAAARASSSAASMPSLTKWKVVLPTGSDGRGTVAEDEHRHAVRRLLAPPARPVEVPLAPVGPEHVAPHDVGAHPALPLLDDGRVLALGVEVPLVQAHGASRRWGSRRTGSVRPRSRRPTR